VKRVFVSYLQRGIKEYQKRIVNFCFHLFIAYIALFTIKRSIADQSSFGDRSRE